MTPNLLQWLAAVMLGLAGAMNLVRAGRHGDPVKAKNARLSGYLFLLSAAIFAVIAAGVLA